MPTPDEVYEQVLAEETAKGSSPAVAQARAKAARVRAQRGSTDPNKPDPSTAPPPTVRGGPAELLQRRLRRRSSRRPRRPAAEAEAREQPTAAAATPSRRPRSPRPDPVARSGQEGRGQRRPAAVPERVQRLLAVVKPEAIQKVERQPMDRVNVWPHLMAAEFVSLLVVMALLTFFSFAVDAPLRELANFNQTPNPSKAPWYFLGLQELLRYFHPQVAGVTIPNVLIIIACSRRRSSTATPRPGPTIASWPSCCSRSSC